MNIRRFFLSRTTVIILIGLLLAAVLVASLVPQTFLASPDEMMAWHRKYPSLVPLAGVFGLHHVFTTPWFAVILLLALISLTWSTVDQCRSAWRKTFAPALPAEEGEVVSLGRDELASRLRRNGYLPVESGKTLRFVRHPWGYWGNAFLHGGMVAVIAASLLIALTQQRGSLAMFEGEVHYPDDPWTVEESGLMVGRLVLPEPVRLERVRPAFRPNHKVKQIASDLSFLPDGEPEHHVTVEVNAMASRRGIVVYQSTDVGDSFSVEFTDPSGRTEIFRLPINHPESLEEAGYNDFRFPWNPLKLQAKYYVDAERKKIDSAHPLLILRMMDGDQETGRVSLTPGGTGALGEYRVRLAGVQRWTTIIFVKLTGMSGVFLGFFLIILGAALAFCTPPRELVATPAGDGWLITWRAGRFGDFYRDESETLFRDLQRKGTP
ncbi:cytochrome c biogenesis protein ResB [Geobacter sulfurreducens]|uniref:cytochrome c biogenesis protein ResB n=1 Tax=Geobacter sulfurreducens TaxID=35554 RepID=UPI002C55585D|nr:cytochrome c biogenesis protein ResB [Geobacter sulfurreducens]HML76717.1 cytochrome c biogenesis protein ResB [Geobacter sulfurreducens]